MRPGAAKPHHQRSTVLAGRCYVRIMEEEYVIPEPEPKEIDETLSMELRHLSSNAQS